MPSVTLTTPLEQVLSKPVAGKLQRAFGLASVEDLLWHLPRRYALRGELTPLANLPVGEQVTVLARVLTKQTRRMQRRRGEITNLVITDGSGRLQLTFFKRVFALQNLAAGDLAFFSGKVTLYRGELQLQHPDFKVLDKQSDLDLAAPDLAAPDLAAVESAKEWAKRPVPIYPASAQITSWQIQAAIAAVLKKLPVDLRDPLPQQLLDSAGITSLYAAFRLAHLPDSGEQHRAGLRSLRFREAFSLQLSLCYRRARMAEERSVPRVAGQLLQEFDAGLPFQLSAAQREVGDTIAAELAAQHPMQRLLQGEVGAGKTVVALRAVLQIAESGGQSALLAPTEVLAGQHYRSLTRALGPQLTARLQPVLLTAKLPTAQKRRALLDLAAGVSLLAVGTHALFSEGVSFNDLGLAVIDEQHRFGVEQREALRLKGASPHVLAMTATPIPRTVALTVFGDLELLTMRGLPPGRQAIKTFVVPELERPAHAARVWQRAAEEIAAGRQVYVVCPAISDSAAGSEIANVTAQLAALREHPALRGVRMAALTGELSSTEKDRVLCDFAEGKTQLLVATTVVEVGVDVPNASLMVVLDADRFGMSQLHQLRGRVGRGQDPGLCLLLTKAVAGTLPRQRLQRVAELSDGFALAEADLELRHEGDILGTRQSGGRSALKLLRVVKDGRVIAQARDLALALLRADPELKNYQLLREQVLSDIAQLDNLRKF